MSVQKCENTSCGVLLKRCDPGEHFTSKRCVFITKSKSMLVVSLYLAIKSITAVMNLQVVRTLRELDHTSLRKSAPLKNECTPSFFLKIYILYRRIILPIKVSDSLSEPYQQLYFSKIFYLAASLLLLSRPKLGHSAFCPKNSVNVTLKNSVTKCYIKYFIKLFYHNFYENGGYL